MICVAFRKSPNEKAFGDVVTLNTISGVLFHCDRDGAPRLDSFTKWTDPTQERFNQWVSMYQNIWTLHPSEAYWVKCDLELDEGL